MSAEQHPQRGTADYGDKRVVFCRQHDGCNLRLVTDFSQEKRDERDEEHSVASMEWRVFFHLSQHKSPDRDRHKREAKSPSNMPPDSHHVMHPLPYCTGNGVVRDRRAKNAQDDGNRPPEAGCQQQSEQLRFVAYLTDSNDERRDNECFHGLAPLIRAEMNR